MVHCKAIGFGWAYASFTDKEDEKVKTFYNTSKALKSTLQVEEVEQSENETQENMRLEATTTILKRKQEQEFSKAKQKKYKEGKQEAQRKQ